MTIRKTSFRGTIYTLLAYGCVPVAFILQLACMKQSISIKETFNVKKKKNLQISQCFCLFYLEITLWRHYLFERVLSNVEHKCYNN